ncbi:diiron oxygenase [Calidifontibacter sp. DB0510]|uniref:Diiron oxygenase n=1 Tax=Metallococcus carri TaxID=1656884 RepID=A0A967AZJ3_9MICO|nr:diiron oxygenase [Metallococcus carri]NHN54505.1 diiron oxygenase [Metallococcus carri]NOP36656.1 diiron oxygenase [Calidifontibacter sp. DB2511S]
MTTTLERTTQLDDATSRRLLISSVKQAYDPEVDIDWTAPLVEGRFFMQPERMSLFGTPTWERLTDEQRIEMSRHEVCSIAGVGIWFELILMQMVVRDLYDDDPRSERMQYALTELGDECRHSVMFGKFIDRCGVDYHRPPVWMDKLGALFRTIGFGASAYAAILVAEELLDRWQRELIKDDRLQPLARMVARIHVLEEARHMTFAREEIERTVPTLNPVALTYHQSVLAQTAAVIARGMVNPQVYASVGLDPRAARREAMRNPHYHETLRWMGERVTGFLDEHGLIGPHTRWEYKAVHLM